MTNKEKAAHIVAAWVNNSKGKLQEIIEAELDRFDAPEPKKWEPRGGNFYVDYSGRVLSGLSDVETRFAGREYPTLEEAKRAAPLHRKMDRLVNWMIEHCDNEIELIPRETMGEEFAILFGGSSSVCHKLLQSIESGEVEL